MILIRDIFPGSVETLRCIMYQFLCPHPDDDQVGANQVLEYFIKDFNQVLTHLAAALEALDQQSAAETYSDAEQQYVRDAQRDILEVQRIALDVIAHSGQEVTWDNAVSLQGHLPVSKVVEQLQNEWTRCKYSARSIATFQAEFAPLH
jgi:hypothetical protein